MCHIFFCVLMYIKCSYFGAAVVIHSNNCRLNIFKFRTSHSFRKTHVATRLDKSSIHLKATYSGPSRGVSTVAYTQRHSEMLFIHNNYHCRINSRVLSQTINHRKTNRLLTFHSQLPEIKIPK